MILNYASTDEEARQRFEKYKSKDPFPSIAPALLCSADIMDYVSAAGIILPFYESKLKSATYEVSLLGKIHYWDENGTDRSKVMLSNEDKFKLKRNSIAFVFLETSFRVPDYIALRFNLRIKHVHQGLLLGTGPLIDPGFEGRLLVPVHNLTANDYVLTGGEGLIWVEFTKLNMLDEWKCDDKYILERHGNYKSFPKEKINKSASYYFADAVGEGNNIRSSIPDVISGARLDAEKAKEDANNSKKEAEKSERHSKWQMVATFISILVVVVGIMLTVPQIVAIIKENSRIMNEQTNVLKDRIRILEEIVNKLDLERAAERGAKKKGPK